MAEEMDFYIPSPPINNPFFPSLFSSSFFFQLLSAFQLYSILYPTHPTSEGRGVGKEFCSNGGGGPYPNTDSKSGPFSQLLV